MNSPDLDTRPREQLGALYEIGRTVNSALELPEVLDGILGMTLQLFTADAGSIMLLREGKLRIEAARGLPEDVVQTTEIGLGEGIAGWVARTGEMLLLNGKVDDSRFHGVVNRRDEITSSLCTPLRSRSGVIGVMMVRRGGPTTFNRGQLEFFSSVADQAAIAIENARLFRSELKRAQQLEIAQRKFEAIFSAMADGVLVTDAEGAVVHANDAARRLLGADEPLLDRRISEFLPSLPMEHIRAQVVSGEGPYELEAQLKGLTLRVTVTALGDEGEESHELVFLFHDVTERVRVERMKSEFLSAVSHELKTPLTTVTGFLELLLHRDFERPRQEQYLRISLEEAGRLQRLIEDLLTLSRLESGRFELQRKEGRLEEVTAKVLTGFTERHPTFEFRLVNEDALPPLSMDQDLMAQVILNLLSNSVKYSPEGGRVEVRIRREGGCARVSVRDEGIGIPKDKIPYIFEKFYRVDNSLTRSTGGTGLGLANARYIVEGHGGSIWAESDGQGTVFTFELPLEPPAPRISEPETRSEA